MTMMAGPGCTVMRNLIGACTHRAMGTRTGAGTETRMESRVEGKDSPGSYEVIKEVGRKTRKRGRHQ